VVLIGWTLVSERFLPQAPPVSAPTPGTPASAPAAPAPAAPAVMPGAAGTAPAPAASTAPLPVARRAEVLARSPRLAIETPRLSGSVNLVGARFDDLVLDNYKQVLGGSEPIRLFSPSGSEDAYFAQFGWSGPGAPPLDALWTASAQTLAPGQPVTLSWTSPTGLIFEQRLEVDKDFLFTVRKRVRNPGAADVVLQPWGLVSRLGEGTEQNAFNLHVGPLGVLDGTLKDSGLDFEALREDGPQRFTSTGGWLGMTEKYWLAAIVPDQTRKLEARFAAAPGNLYQVDYLGEPLRVPAGGSAETLQRLFAGAKEVSLLDRYRDEFGIPRLDRAVSWGWFEVIAQPIFYLLDWLFRVTGNFGVAIIILTLIVRAALFPIANKQYESMAKMRIVAPRMKAIQERNKDDKLKAQQEMMALYKTEKVNPLAGCLPLILQIPIFYALYKTLLVSTEMRHQPFFLWIEDLSAPDPVTPLNLFGLIDWQPPSIIAIGVLPILLGVTMWVQQRMNPTPLDPVQKQVFAIMPWMFMFIMAPFAAGLQLYWTVNNLVSIGQQWYMLRKYPMPSTPPDAAPSKPVLSDKPPLKSAKPRASGGAGGGTGAPARPGRRPK
jgi:YidC/Oxa1 family membrane protein insertase